MKKLLMCVALLAINGMAFAQENASLAFVTEIISS